MSSFISNLLSHLSYIKVAIYLKKVITNDIFANDYIRKYYEEGKSLLIVITTLLELLFLLNKLKLNLAEDSILLKYQFLNQVFILSFITFLLVDDEQVR